MLLLCLPFSPLSAAQVTFHKDVVPVVQKHCQGCHRPGEAAPFSLLSYQDARPWAKSIRAAVLARKMPPWFADSAHGKFANDPRLSTAEIETLKNWVDSGAPEGKPSDAPPPLAFDDNWKIGKPDLIVELPADFPVPASGTVDYTWFAADMGLKEDTWVERIEVRPGARSVVHHTLVFAREPGSKFRADLQPGAFKGRPEVPPKNRKEQNDRGNYISDGAGGVEMIGDYVPNGDPFIAAPGQGRLIRAGSHMLFQMHYTTNGKAATDRTRVGLVFSKTRPQERIVNNAIFNMSLRIPPGAANHEVSAVVTVHRDTKIGGFGPHMHVRGKAMKFELLRQGAEPQVLLNVPGYDFNWQLKYQPAEFVALNKGDQLRVTAWYDNSPNNPHNPDPSKEVFWGDQSWSEMLFWFFDYVVPANVNPEEVTKAKTPAAPATAP